MSVDSHENHSLTVTNPILPGFHPDPSILKDGDNYYIATSTFEWYPGIMIYHSTNLKNWALISTPLSRLSQLDMRGIPDSCGVWAPCLSKKADTYYLAYSSVRRFGGDFKDTHNFYVTAHDISGPWSDPIYVNSSGFDPSLFHDDDGKSWWLNMIWDHRAGRGRNSWLPHHYFGGIRLQEIDLESGQLSGPAKIIYRGSSRGLSEGPHLYKRNGYYHLLVAEGGTGKDHAVTHARSHDIFGPYETDPQGSLLSAAELPDAPLKRTGHADWVETDAGEIILAHLCSRPLPYRGRSVMGRETALQKAIFDADGWLRLSHEGIGPKSSVEFKGFEQDRSQNTIPVLSESIDFRQQSLPQHYQSLRYPLPESVLNYSERPGWLRLRGQEAVGSLFEQSLIARRQQAFRFDAITRLDYSPTNFQQMAGIICYYNTLKFYYWHVGYDEERGRILDLVCCLGERNNRYPLNEPIPIPQQGEISLKISVDQDLVRFYYSLDNTQRWQDSGLCMDYSVLSDEVGDNGADANFTGAFVGISSNDSSGEKLMADFGHFEYKEK